MAKKERQSSGRRGYIIEELMYVKYVRIAASDRKAPIQRNRLHLKAIYSPQGKAIVLNAAPMKQYGWGPAFKCPSFVGTVHHNSSFYSNYWILMCYIWTH